MVSEEQRKKIEDEMRYIKEKSDRSGIPTFPIYCNGYLKALRWAKENL